MKRIYSLPLFVILTLINSCTEPPVDPRDILVGTWEVEVEEECDTFSSEFDDTIFITKGVATNELLFRVDDLSLRVNLNGSSFTVPVQEVDDEEEFSGSGYFSGATVHMNLHYEDNDSGEECDYEIDGFKR